MTNTARWLIGALAAILGTLFSFIVNQVVVNTSRLATLEQRMMNGEQFAVEMRLDLKEHRATTENGNGRK